jgi:hypothetical protein
MSALRCTSSNFNIPAYAVFCMHTADGPKTAYVSHSLPRTSYNRKINICFLLKYFWLVIQRKCIYHWIQLFHVDSLLLASLFITVLTEKLITAQLIKKLSTFMKPEGSRGTTTGPYIEPVKSSPHFHALSLQDEVYYFNLTSNVRVSQVAFFSSYDKHSALFSRRPHTRYVTH